MFFLFRLHVQLPALRQRDNLYDMYLRLVLRQIRGEVQRFVRALHGTRHGFINVCHGFISVMNMYIYNALCIPFLSISPLFHLNSTIGLLRFIFYYF